MMSKTGNNRGVQVTHAQQRIRALAEAHRHSGNAFYEGVTAAMSQGEIVAPEVVQAVKEMRKAYARCAKDLEKICAMLDPYTYDQSGDNYAEL